MILGIGHKDMTFAFRDDIQCGFRVAIFVYISFGRWRIEKVSAFCELR
jgi:hypothetical protein